MADTGTLNPSAASTSGITTDWTGPTNVYASDDSRATAALTGGSFSAANTRSLNVTGFGASIPGTATIDGILVEIERSVTSTSGTPRDSTVMLLGITGATTDKAVGTTWPTSDAYASYGGAADKWGAGSIAVSEINDAAFGVMIGAQVNTGEGISTTVRVDHVRITVYYTTASGDTTSMFQMF